MKLKGGYKEFVDALGKRESDNDYKCVNKFGFVGRWQFGKPRLYDMGISLDGWHPSSRPKLKVVTQREFLNDPKLQDAIMLKHVKAWLSVIRRKYKSYEGKTIADIYITESGMVAGLHLKGEGSAKYPGLRQFLETGTNNVDGLGTGITEYISKFGGYDLRDDKIKQYIDELGETPYRGLDDGN